MELEEQQIMGERQRSVAQIKLFEQKLAWVLFDITREVVYHLREDKSEPKAKVRASLAPSKPNR